MKIKTYNYFLYFTAALAFVLFSCPSASAGPLRMLTSGGPDTAFGVITFSESDIDFMRPADLIEYNSGRFAITREYESVIDQKQGDMLMNLSTARKLRVEFMHPINKNRKYRSATGGTLFSSSMKYVTDDRLGGSSLYSKGSGGSFAFAQQAGRFTLGVFRNTSGNNGTGTSAEINQRVELLASDADIFTSLSATREGYHFKTRLTPSFSAGFIKESGDYRGLVDFTDGTDTYSFPGFIGSERREIIADYRINSRYSLSGYYNHGSLSNLDGIYYNNSLEIGRWLTAGEFDSRSFFLRKSPSENRTLLLGYEDYDGYYRLAGTVDLLGSIADLLSGYYLFHSHGFMHRQTYKYSLRKKKGNYTYRFMYSYSTGDAFQHYDSSRRVFLSWSEKANESVSYDYTQHLLGIGIEKEISKGMIFRYSILQVIPLLDKIEEQTISPGGPSTTGVSESKITRGGTLHLISLVFPL